ncbi:MAG: hypothetical protein IPN33_26200 [Saprospiraceae bacterium]|nr:hypothetical protein [Saprospiraceae bacterium]
MVTSTNVTTGEASQMSVAVAIPVTAGDVLAVHDNVTPDGHVMTGGVLSSTVMVCVHLIMLPAPSVAVGT